MTFNKQKALLIGTYGLIHGFVDFCCAAMLFSFLGKVEIVFLLQLAILGMFFFNLTMPITMTALANMMPKVKGFSFGLTTLALLIGYLPVMCEYKVSQSMLFFEILFASVIVTAISLKLYEKLFHRP